MKIKILALACVCAFIAIFTLSLGAYTGTKSKSNTLTLSKDNVVSLNGPITPDSVTDAIQSIRELNKEHKSKPVYLFINSPGGSIQAGLQLVEAIQGQPRKTHTIALFAASMGFQLIQQLGNRYVMKSSVLMSHHAHGGAEGDFAGKTPNQLQSRLGLWERKVLELDLQTVLRTNGKQTLKSYQEAYDHELWLTGQEALTQGYADEIATVHCDESLNGVITKQTSVSTVFGDFEVKYDVDACPLNPTIRNIRSNGVEMAPAILQDVKQKLNQTFTQIAI